MKIHEYQAKEVLKKYGVPVPQGSPATSAERAGAIARELGGGPVVVKAQIHAGGRGKGGGVKLVADPEEAQKAAETMLGMNLVTGEIFCRTPRRKNSQNLTRTLDSSRRAVHQAGQRRLQRRCAAGPGGR